MTSAFCTPGTSKMRRSGTNQARADRQRLRARRLRLIDGAR
jgi:hypothetical protein